MIHSTIKLAAFALSSLFAAPAEDAPLPAEAEGITRDRLLNHIEALTSEDFEGRAAGTDGGQMGASYVQQQFEALGLTPKGTKKFRQAFKARGKKLTNVVGMLKGYDEKLSKEYVVIGAHFDHLGIRKEKMYPGADDNASGCATMFEIARAFSEGGKPARSIVFIGFDGEEIGLLGSRQFVKKPTVPKKRIVAMINLDMVGRGETGDVRVCGTPTSTLLKSIVERTAPRVELKLHYDFERQWRRASDHGPFGDAEIPFLYFGVVDHGDYHKPTDAADKINGPKIERIARLVYLTAREIADGQEEVEWEK